MHGFADYFFQTPAADFWVERGYDFYALDLRKYGRSLRDAPDTELRHRPHDYYPEIDEAYAGSSSATATATWSSPPTPPAG